jgi:hypothetical protein
MLQLLTHVSVFKALILLEMVPLQPYARQFLVCGISRRKGSCSLHNACIALDHSNNVLLFIHVSPHSTFEGHDSLGKANFFSIVEGQHSLHDGSNVFPSMPYNRNMLHHTLNIMLVASLLHYEYKLSCIPKRNFAQTPFLFHPPLICPLSYYIIHENWFHDNTELHTPKDLKNNLQKSSLTKEG